MSASVSTRMLPRLEPDARPRELFLERVRIGAVIILSALVVFVGSDVFLGRDLPPGVHALQLTEVLVVIALLAAVRRPTLSQQHVALAALAIAVLGAVVAAAGILRGDPITPAILCSVITLVAGALLPWGVRAQIAVVLAVSLALAWNVGVVTGGLSVALSYPGMAVGVALAGSVFVANEIERSRAAAFASERSRARAEALTLGQKRVLELIAQGAPLRTTLECLARAVEAQSEGAFCSVLLVDDHRPTLRHAAAPSLPPDYVKAVDGVEMGPSAGSCGTAAYRGETVIVEDIQTDPLWQNYRGVAQRHGLRACWSTPIAASTGEVIGTFAMYYGRPRKPSPRESELIESAGQLAAIAIERKRVDRRQRHEARISGGLARVGEALISSLDQPVVLDRLCLVTAEVLGADASYTYLRRTDGRQELAAAYSADGPSIVPDAVHQSLLAALADCGTSIATHAEGGVAYIGMALQRGADLIGLQIASLSRPGPGFGPLQGRIAAGISQLASLALQNARMADELARASKLKSEFVSTISHELRTPLNVIIGYAGLLLDDAFGEMPGPQRQPLQRLDRSARQLLELVNATLDVARLDSGRTPVRLQALRLDELFAELEAETRPVAEEKPSLVLQWHLEPEIAEFRTDRAKLKIILKNLIGNALKFTERGSVTTVGIRRPDGIEFRVADTGVGIPKDALAIIFDAFRQVDASDTRRHGGVGLGLYIARRTVDLLGGTIDVESSVGRGSTFRVFLPHDTAAPAVRDVA